MTHPQLALIMIESDPLVAVAPTESVTVTVKIEVPAVGVPPAIIPVSGVKVAQAGRLPVAIDHVYGVIPPDALSSGDDV